MQAGNFQDADDVMNLVNAHSFGKVGQTNDARRRPVLLDLLQERDRLGLDGFMLLVGIGGEKPETIMLELELAAGFGDAPLADDQGLLPAGQHVTNDGPFLECMF